MVLLCCLIALALLQSYTVASSLQKDQWFYNWLGWLEAKIDPVDNALLFPVLALAAPLFILSIGLALLATISLLLVFFTTTVLGIF